MECWSLWSTGCFVVSEVRGVELEGGQAAEETSGELERDVGIGAAHKRRDSRRFLPLSAAFSEATQLAMEATTVAWRGESGAQQQGGAEGKV